MIAVGKTGGHPARAERTKGAGRAKDGTIGKDGEITTTVAGMDLRPLPALPGIREGAEVGRTKEVEEAAGTGELLSFHHAKLVAFIQPMRRGRLWLLPWQRVFI